MNANVNFKLDNKKVMIQTILIIVGLGLVFVLGANMELFESFGISPGENFNAGQFIVQIFLIALLVSVVLIILKEAFNIEVSPLRLGISSFTALYLTFLFRKPVLPSSEQISKLMRLEPIPGWMIWLIGIFFFVLNLSVSYFVYRRIINRKTGFLAGILVNLMFLLVLIKMGLYYAILTVIIAFVDITLLFTYTIPGAIVWGFIFHFTEAGELMLSTELSGSSAIVNAVYLVISFPIFYLFTTLYINILKSAFEWARSEENRRKVSQAVENTRKELPHGLKELNMIFDGVGLNEKKKR